MTQELQFDHTLRIVALANLRAMCSRVSGVCHRYTVVETRGRFVHVEYSNPDEYGHESPMVARLPKVPYAGEIGVILQIYDVKHDNWDGEGWQAFQPLLDCPTLWRSPDDGTWKTREEIVEDA